MNVLAFDTCLGAVSAAVRWRGSEGWLLRDACEVRSSGHAERLLPMIAEVMQAAGLDFAALDRIAVTLGPGGFTSVRVGVSVARALALATGKPVVGATSLAVMAHRAAELLAGAAKERRLAVAVDAHRGALFVQGFGADAAEAGPALLQSPHEAALWVGREPAVIVGSAAAGLAALVREAGGDAEPSLPDLQPRARNLALMAESLTPLASVRPLYLRAPDARPQDAAALARAHPETQS